MQEELPNNSLLEPLLDIWRRRRWILIATFISVFTVAAGLILALPALYQSSATILAGQEDVSQSYIKSSVTGSIEQRLQIIREAVMSRSQLNQLIQKYNLYPDLRREAPPETVLDRMRHDIQIKEDKSSQQWGQESSVAVTISYQGWDPQLVAKITNRLTELYKQKNGQIRHEQASATAKFLKQQLSQAKQRLVDQEDRINKYKNSHLGELPEQEGLNMETLKRLNSELSLNGEKQIRLMKRRDDILASVKDGDATNGTTAAGASRLDSLKKQLADLKMQYTDKYPEVIRLKHEIQEVENQPRGGGGDAQAGDDTVQGISKQLALLQGREHELRTRIDKLQHRVEYAPKIEQGLKRLTRDYNSMQEEYASLQKRYQNSKVSESLENSDSGGFRILESAVPARLPVAPRRLRLLVMALVMAAGVAAGVVFLLEQFDDTFHSLKALRDYTRLPVLGIVPKIRTAGDRWRLFLKSGFAMILLLAGLMILTRYSYLFGQHAEQLVWMMAGRGA